MIRAVALANRTRCRSTRLCLESLEARQLLAGDSGAALVPPSLAIDAASYFAATGQMVQAFPIEGKNVPAPAGMPADLVNRVDHAVWSALQNPASAGNLASPGAVRADAAGRVQVYLRVTEPVGALTARLGELGVQVDTASDAAGLVQAWISAADLSGVLALPGVRSVRAPQYALPRVTSVGDSIHQADEIRASVAGLNGSGVKIGVISLGLDNLATVGAEVPSVTLDPDHITAAGKGNEGTAMMEIIHDVAPGAQLYFSGPNTSLDMIAAINYMVATAGVDVIVDDLGFLDQKFFEDGAIAQAAKAASDAGVVYISAAGNDGVSHYQARFQGGTLFPDTHYFEVDVANLMPFTVPLNGTFDAVLQWSDPFGSSANDYDMAVSRFTGGGFELVASSVNEQDGSPGSDPFEEIKFVNTFPGAIFVLQVSKFFGDPRELEFYLYGINGIDPTYIVSADSLYGAAAANGVIAVGAADSTDLSKPDYYSSRGPFTNYTNYVTQTKNFRLAMDGLSVDNVQTAVGQAGLFDSPFLGTSAAAPHVAGIVALLLQTKPDLTPGQITNLLQGTATDLPPGGYDSASGAGLFNAYNAVLALLTPAAPRLTAATDTGLSKNDGITSASDVVVTGGAPAGSYVRLFSDGLEIAATQLAVGETEYSLSLNALGEGSYQLAVNMAPSVFTPIEFRSALSAAFTLTVDTTGPAIPNAPDLDNAASDPDGNNVTTDSTPQFNVSGVTGAYWTIYRDGIVVSGPPLVGDDGKIYKGPGGGSESLATQAGGTGQFTVRARDAAGNESEASAALQVTIEAGAPPLAVTNTNNDGPGSLRAAIVAANAAAGADAIHFDIAAASPQVIQLASPLPNLNDAATLLVDAGDAVEVGTAAGNFTFANYPALSLDGGGKLTVAGVPVHSQSAAINVLSGELRLGSSEQFAAISLSAGSKLSLRAAGGIVLETAQLAIDPGARIDLADNDMIVHASPANRLAVFAMVAGSVQTGFANFTWTGPGINSSVAATDPTLLTAIGVMLNDNGLGGPYRPVFSGRPVGLDDVLVKYTYYGDADLSGVVDGTDYALTDNGFNSLGRDWFNGDFDYSSAIDGTDYALIDNSFNSSGGPLAGSAPQAVVLDDRPGRTRQAAAPAIDSSTSGSPWITQRDRPISVDDGLLDEGLIDLLATPLARKRRK